MTHQTPTAVQISDEAMQDALDATQGNIPPVMLEKALCAILPHLSVPCAVEVKRLEWDDEGYTTKGIDLVYGMSEGFDGEHYIYRPFHGKYGSKKEAKAAAQADFERRILTCVVTKPADVSDADGSMTAEEIRLENLKQMAMYDGAIVSFECREPFYLASCDHCGWVGSSELCGTDSFGDDSDVYCPRCHSSGADCGSVAERINCQPVDVAALLNSAALIVEGRCTAINNEFIQKLSKRNVYEIAALVADHDIKLGAAIRALSAEPAQGEQWRDIATAPNSEMLLLACADWPLVKCGREVPVKVGHKSFGSWTVLGASWTPTHWMPLPAAPTAEAWA